MELFLNMFKQLMLKVRPFLRRAKENVVILKDMVTKLKWKKTAFGGKKSDWLINEENKDF